MLRPGSDLMKRLIKMSGNIGGDELSPSIWSAQVTDIKRILTTPLYEKILADFTADTLTGEYLIIYDEYVSLMLVFYATSHFVMNNSIMITRGGNYKHTAENAINADYKEVDRLSKYYRGMGADFELQFYEYMKDKNLPEYTIGCNVDTNTFKFGWFI